MSEKKEDYSFWTKNKKFAVTEILMYVVMIIAIVAGIYFLS